MVRSKLIQLIVWGVALGLLLAGAFWWYDASHYDYVSGDPAPIADPFDCATNHLQYDSDIWLGIMNGSLICYMKPRVSAQMNPPIKNRILRIDGTEITEAVDFKALLPDEYGDVSLRATASQFMFLTSENTETGVSAFFRYDRAKNEMTMLASDFSLETPCIYLHEDKAAFLKRLERNGLNSKVLFADRDSASVTTIFEMPEYDRCGEAEYCIAPNEYGGSIRVYSRIGGGAWEAVESVPGDEKTLIQTEYGLLIHHHYKGLVLQMITEDGAVRDLFDVPYESAHSTVAVCGQYAYVSVRKRTDITFGFNKTYEYDGTYRIDLKNGDAEKLNDRYFKGLFIFDDTGLYACDTNFCIVKLDLSGNVVGYVLRAL